MTPKLIPLKEFLKKDLLAYPIPNRDTILENFKEMLQKYREKYNNAFQENQDEEHFKNLFNDLIKSSFPYDINNSKRIDSAIRDKDGDINTLIETKRPTNIAEMISTSNLNRKAFHEALLYFYQQTIQNNVKTINNIFITDCRYLFVFSASEFKKLTDNKSIVKILKGYCSKELKLLSTTKDAYSALEAELKNLAEEIKFCAVDLFDKNNHIELIYRLLDKYSLFNLSLPNDNNTLNEKFYKELLYIMGLEEAKDSDKKIDTIIYKKLDTPENGSLMKLVLDRLDPAKLKELPEWEGLADTDEKRTEEVALELVLTWVNRLLFLKLLEAQLISYHKGISKELIEKYRFLSPKNLSDWHKVYELFFDILAKPLSERGHQHIPYLNSSLFEKTPYEDKFFSVDALKPQNLVFANPTVLEKTGAKPTLSYLLEFLDAYDFGSGDRGFDRENRLINASVLGLVFEKINGYREGAVFTPSFITMSMSKEALTHTVIQKFNEAKNWNCASLPDLKNKIIQTDLPLADANRIFNSIRICDPAVGSGHFLVSCLNELLRLKYELKILINRKGELISHCDMSILHDELIIDYNGKPFTYKVNAKNTPLVQECQSLQETLFHEKEALIENCLFGVDINPKSAYICQLRLWIELLKNTYYIQDGDRQNLQTLPNIDINIKIGNSLVSRFPIKQDFSLIMNALKSKGISMDLYRKLVSQYKNAPNKNDKAKIKDRIEQIKTTLKESFLTNETEYEKLNSKYRKLVFEYEEIKRDLYHIDNEKLTKLENDIAKAKETLDKTDSFYYNSMEWRYEFPEVLDENGTFLGFDLVIGNPPYFRYSRKIPNQDQQIDYFRSHNIYNVACVGKINAYEVFLLLSYHLCKDGGFISEIFQNSFLADTAAKGVRKHYIENTNILQINSFPEEYDTKKRVFENVKMSVLTLFAHKKGGSSTLPIKIYSDRMQSPPKEIETDISLIRQIDAENMEIPNLNKKELAVFAKCYTDTMKIENIADVNKGELNLTFCSKYFTNDPTQTPFIVGANVQKYYITDTPSQRKVPLFFDKEKFLEENHQNKTEHFKLPRVIYQGIMGINNRYRILATIGAPNTFCGNTIDYFIMTNPHYNIYFMVGLMNSWLLNWIFKARSSNAHTNTYEIKRLPIPQASPAEQEPIIDLVKQCMDAKAKDKNADISPLQRQIDELVYDLYGLTEDEIKIVEG